MKSGRTKLTCNKCSKPFSTHSTNRSFCYSCKDYCRERHYFLDSPKKVEKKDEKGKKEKAG